MSRKPGWSEIRAMLGAIVVAVVGAAVGCASDRTILQASQPPQLPAITTTTTPGTAARYAVIVGADEYLDPNFNLPFVPATIDTVKAALTAQLAIPADDTHLLVMTGREVSGDVFRAAIRRIANTIAAAVTPSAEKPFVVVYWVGHGITGRTGDLHLYVYATQFDGEFYSPTLSVSGMAEALAPLRGVAEVAMVVEACRLPALAAVADARMEPAGAVTAFSCGRGQLVLAPPVGELPLYTREWVAALTAYAERDGEFDFLNVIQRAELQTRQKNPLQRPDHVASVREMLVTPRPPIALRIEVVDAQLREKRLPAEVVVNARRIEPQPTRGVFELPQVTAGNYDIGVSAPDYLPRQSTLTVPPTTGVQTVQIPLLPAYIEIIGRVHHAPASAAAQLTGPVSGVIRGYHRGDSSSPVPIESDGYVLRLPPFDSPVTLLIGSKSEFRTLTVDPAAAKSVDLEFPAEGDRPPHVVKLRRIEMPDVNFTPVTAAGVGKDSPSSAPHGGDGGGGGGDVGDALVDALDALVVPDDFSLTMVTGGATGSSNRLAGTMVRLDATLDTHIPKDNSYLRDRFGFRWLLAGETVPKATTQWGQIGLGFHGTIGLVYDADASWLLGLDLGAAWRGGEFLGAKSDAVLPTVGLSLPFTLYFSDEDSGVFVHPSARFYFAIKPPAETVYPREMLELRVDLGVFLRPISIAASAMFQNTQNGHSAWFGVAVGLDGWPFRRYWRDGKIDGNPRVFVDEESWRKPLQRAKTALSVGYFFRTFNLHEDVNNSPNAIKTTVHGPVLQFGVIEIDPSDGSGVIFGFDVGVGRLVQSISPTASRELLAVGVSGQLLILLDPQVFIGLRLRIAVDYVPDGFFAIAPVTDIGVHLNFVAEGAHLFVGAHIAAVIADVASVSADYIGSAVSAVAGIGFAFD